MYGLYGAGSMNWRMSLQSKREAAMARFWDVISFALNGIIFFYVGASSANFVIRCDEGRVERPPHGRTQRSGQALVPRNLPRLLHPAPLRFLMLKRAWACGFPRPGFPRRTHKGG